MQRGKRYKRGKVGCNVTKVKRSTEPRTIGIYCIRNRKNGLRYIGKSTWIERRWKKHRGDLNDRVHHNYRLQADWNKYGARAFQFSVVEECSKRRLRVREAAWIQRQGDYNIVRPVVSRSRGRASQSSPGWLPWVVFVGVFVLLVSR